ncbi:MAG: LacI family DNA-binding transcriptional regulator [Pseudomonadota bacterium]
MTKKRKSGSVLLTDVAERAGVSISTVSNVLNGRKRFSSKTQTKVEKAIADLNYMTDKAASSLRSAKQWTISFLIRDTASEFLSDAVTAGITAGLSEVLNEHGYDLQIKLCADKVVNINEVFRRRSTDALIVTSSGTPTELKQVFKTVSQLGVPMVLVKHKYSDAFEDLAIVDQKDDEAGRMIVEHLIARNARRFWFISNKTRWHTIESRFAGVKKALSSLAVDSEMHLIRSETERFKDTRDAVAAFAETNDPPDAIIGGNDSLAIAAMHAMRERGLNPPTDILVAGFNGLDAASYAYPSLTTVVSPVKEIGREAGLLALKRLENGEFPIRKTVFPYILRLGEST